MNKIYKKWVIKMGFDDEYPKEEDIIHFAHESLIWMNKSRSDYLIASVIKKKSNFKDLAETFLWQQVIIKCNMHSIDIYEIFLQNQNQRITFLFFSCSFFVVVIIFSPSIDDSLHFVFKCQLISFVLIVVFYYLIINFLFIQT